MIRKYRHFSCTLCREIQFVTSLPNFKGTRTELSLTFITHKLLGQKFSNFECKLLRFFLRKTSVLRTWLSYVSKTLEILQYGGQMNFFMASFVRECLRLLPISKHIGLIPEHWSQTTDNYLNICSFAEKFAIFSMREELNWLTQILNNLVYYLWFLTVQFL